MKMSRIETAMRVTLAYYAAFNAHDVAGMMQLISEDCVLETGVPAPDGLIYSGKEAVARSWQDFFHEATHAHIDLEEVFGLGMRCIVRLKLEWVDATGTDRHIRGAEIFRVKEGLICETFAYRKG
jgi:ketosteroid isomerase-like protein